MAESFSNDNKATIGQVGESVQHRLKFIGHLFHKLGFKFRNANSTSL